MNKLPPPPHPDAYPRLPDTGLRGRDGTYIVDPGLRAAANVALTMEMPLLLTGEPGCGKTDFAFVMANAIDDMAEAGDGDGDNDNNHDNRRGLLECHIRSDSRARDLLYHYDALLRFGEANHGSDEDRERSRDARNYIELQALGIALMSSRHRVVLMDEIDKAPRDLPNDLLRELDRGEFEIPEIRLTPGTPGSQKDIDDRSGVPLGRIMKRPDGAPMPILIITSNVERQLPDPFLRRCVFYHIPFPDTARLREIVHARYPDRDPLYLDKLIDIFERSRKVPKLVKKAGTAELLAWVGALTRAFEPAMARQDIETFHEALDLKSGVVKSNNLRWTDLPGANCLFKLREDMESAAAHWAPGTSG